MFCDDSYYINDISETVQMGVSSCRNIFYVIIASEVYQDLGSSPTIFGTIKAPANIPFHTGFLVHNYTAYFKTKPNPSKDIKNVWARSRGPIAIFVEVDKGINKAAPDIDIDPMTLKKRFESFIMNTDLSSSVYEPPIDIFNGLIVEEK